MKQSVTRIFILLILSSIANNEIASATAYDVNSLASTNTGSGASGTLSYCISQANTSAGPHTISFSVAGTISMNPSALPVLNQSIIIDGSTAPGYAGSPVIILDGLALGSGNGIEISKANCEIYGLEVTGFPYRGIYINGNAADNFIIGAAGKGNVIIANGYYGISVDGADNGMISYNHIGTDVSGSTCVGNNYDGIDFMNAADNNQVLSNHISCNGYNGIQVRGSNNNVIKGNIIGPLSSTCQGNSYRGVDIEDGSQNNIVGGINPAEFNKITGNQYWGIEVKDSAAENVLSGNIYLCNVYGAIALNYGGNNTMPAPLITAAGATLITGTASPNSTIEVFKSQNTNSSQCPGTPTNQGADFLGTCPADASGAWSLTGTFGGYVVATATDPNGNTSPFGTSIYISPDTLMNECSGSLATVSASFNSSATGVCEKSCIDFTDQSQNAASWNWYFEGGSPNTSNQQNPLSICYNDSGVYPVTLVVYDANGIDSSVAILYITVYPTPPIPFVTQQGDTLTSSTAIGYQWYLNTVAINGATNQQYVALQTGFYYVEITDTSGCTSISQATYIDLTGITIVPDTWLEIKPTNDPLAFQLVIHGMAGMYSHFVLYDLYGRPLMDETLAINSSLFIRDILVPDAADGLYFIQLSAGIRSIAQKIILHH